MPKAKDIDKILLLLILLLAFILRFYRLSLNPPGLYIDEVSIGYNAYCILETGRDEHNQFLPLWFKAFGEYKLPVYIYLTAFSEWLFGVNEFAVRFPSALFGTLTVLVCYFLIKELVPNLITNYPFRPRNAGRKLAICPPIASLLFTLLLAISPWHIHFSRAGFEANVAPFFITLGTLFFVLSVRKSQASLLALSLLSFILSLYTYNASRVFTPLFLLGLFIIYRREIKKFNFTKLALILSLALLLTFPFLKFSFSPMGLARARTESFLSQVVTDENINPLLKLYLYLKQFVVNHLSYFSFNFLFFIGDQNGRHSVREIGEAYLWQLPFFLFGLYVLLNRAGEKKTYFEKITALWLFLSPVGASFTKVNPHALRSLFMVIPLQGVISLGVLKAAGLGKRRLFEKMTFVLVFLFAFYNFISYLHLYWVHYPKKTFLDWEVGFKQLVKEIEKVEGGYSKVLIDNYRSPHTYLFFLFYKKYDPQKFLVSKSRSSFSKYQFVPSPPLAFEKEKLLYAASSSGRLTNASLLKEIKFPDGNTVYKLYELK